MADFHGKMDTITRIIIAKKSRRPDMEKYLPIVWPSIASKDGVAETSAYVGVRT